MATRNQMRIAFATAVLVAGVSASPAANDSAAERGSLAGLSSLSVVVEDVSAVAAKNGVATATLQADVERKLRQASISVTSDADAYLYVHVTVADPGGSFALPYVVEVALMQEVTLPRGVRTRTPLQCATWWVNSLGLSGPDRLRTGVGDRVGEFVDQFIRAYRSVNLAAAK